MGLRTSRLAGISRRFRRNKDGSVAVEFGLLAIPFAIVVFAVLESCVSFAAQQVLANATDDIARQIRTGQPQFRNITEAKLKTEICNRIGLLAGSKCADRLVVDLRSYNTFAEAAAIKIKITNGALNTSGFQVSPGGAASRNMLRVFYKWPVMTDIMRLRMSNMADNTILHVATATWRNERYF